MFFIITVIFISSCTEDKKNILDKNILFTLGIGKMEDQIDFVQLPGESYKWKPRIFMKNGLFYISDSKSGKVMKYTSYGDILSMIYNAENNPMPILLQTESNEEKTSTRAAYAYPFQGIGEIAVTGNEVILIDDRVTEVRREYDSETDTLLDRIVLRFSRKGELIDYLGQEGIGGTPFSYIEKIEVNSSDEIIIFSRNVENWRIFWFSPEGIPLYFIDISLKNLPGPEEEGIVASLEKIISDPDTRTLYLKIDYYKGIVDEVTGVETGIGFYKSSVYWVNMENETYENHVDIPKHIIKIEGNGIYHSDKLELIYEFIGVVSGGNLLFLSLEDTDYYQMLILSKNGKVVDRTLIQLNDSELIYKTLSLDQQGVLSGLLYKKSNIEIVWWRSDKLINQKEETF